MLPLWVVIETGAQFPPTAPRCLQASCPLRKTSATPCGTTDYGNWPGVARAGPCGFSPLCGFLQRAHALDCVALRNEAAGKSPAARRCHCDAPAYLQAGAPSVFAIPSGSAASLI